MTPTPSAGRGPHSAGVDETDSRSVERVQRAALERALVEGDDAPSAFALAGALERVRSERPERDDPLAVALCCLTTMFAIGESRRPSRSRWPPSPPTRRP